MKGVKGDRGKEAGVYCIEDTPISFSCRGYYFSFLGNKQGTDRDSGGRALDYIRTVSKEVKAKKIG